MKRKLILEEFSDNKSLKMLKLNQSAALENMDISMVKYADQERQFEFQLTDKTARANLMKSSKRRMFQIENKQLSKNLKFSPGSYLLVAKPIISEWKICFDNGKSFLVENMNISVSGFHAGLDKNGKHFDTKVEFKVNNEKVVIHCYNSTQNLKVEGGIYLCFIDMYLNPLFSRNTQKMESKIVECDKDVLASLCARGRPVRGRSVKNVRSMIY